jgi:predicted GIY-YIG superfamily endonuclease
VLTVSDGTVYLLHFDQPYKHARHYLGWTADLDARLARHEAGTGARLLEVAHDAGIGWTLARTWEGGRARERQLKNQGGATRRCPLCGVRPRHKKETAMQERQSGAQNARDRLAELPELTGGQVRADVARAVALEQRDHDLEAG